MTGSVVVVVEDCKDEIPAGMVVVWIMVVVFSSCCCSCMQPLAIRKRMIDETMSWRLRGM
jgi:hypothetical protein